MGSNLKYIDLYAGCGGLSWGLMRAGWKGVFAVEKDAFAFSTLQFNLIERKRHFRWPAWLPIGAHDIDEVLSNYRAELGKLASEVDLVVGGPPCQGFSVNGRRDEKDKRNKLVDSYVSFVELVKPRLLFFENVRGFTMEFIKNGSGTVYSDQVAERLKTLGYDVHPEIINFADYGIPQRRWRFILVGILDGRAEDFFGHLKEKKAAFLEQKGLQSTQTVAQAISDLEQKHGDAEWRELIECFYEFALKRLEKYAVDVIKWGNPPRGSDEEVQPKDVKAQILEVINKLTGSDDVLDVAYDPHLLDILAERQSSSVATALTHFRRIAEQSGNDKLRREIARAERRLKQLSEAKEEAEKEARSERRARTLTTKKLEVERRKNLFLIATRRDPEGQRDSLQHWIKVSAQKMGGKISSLIHDIKQDKIDKDRLLEALSKLQFWLDQTVKVSRIVTKADFNLELETIRKDLSRFIFEYLNSDEITRARLKFDVRYDGEPFVVRFRPMEITILFDNLIDNAIKAHARNMRFDIRVAGKTLVISLANDGEAVPKSIMDSLFELGISSRGGSGIAETCSSTTR